MGENVSVPKKNKLHALPFLKVGVLEIGFVAVVLFLLFGILNYFNILSISGTFPKYLSWLPRQTVSQKKLLYTPTTPTPILAPVPEEAKREANNLIKDILKPSFIPDNLTFGLQGKQNLNNSTFNSYGATWRGENGEIFITTVKYNDKNQFVYRYLQVNFPSFLNFDVSSSLNIEKKYLNVVPMNSFSCLTTSTDLSCSSSWKENNANKGINVSNTSRKEGTQLSYCEYHSDAPGYTSNSCGF